MRLPSFEYHAPESLEKALKIKSALGAQALVLAGGTDLIVNLKHGLLSPAALISLKNIKEMRGIDEKPDMLVIKAGTSLDEIARNHCVQTHFPMLRKAVESIGAVGIQRFRGTIGGNLCLQPRCILYNQSFFWRSGKGSCHRTGGKDCLALPGAESCQSVLSGDTIPVLMALAAQLTISGTSGIRIIPISEFFTGKGESPFKLAQDEILTEIRLPLPWAPISGSYQRLSYRSAVDFPLINAAASAIMQNGIPERFRLVLSAAGPAPIVLNEAQEMIKGIAIDPDVLQKVRDIAVKAAEGKIVENSSAPKAYRIKMAGVVASRATREALGLGAS